MTGIAELHAQAPDATGRILRGVPADRWHAATPVPGSDALSEQNGQFRHGPDTPGVVVIRRDPSGLVTLPPRSCVPIPAVLRYRCGLLPGDPVLLAARPPRTR